MPSLSNSFTMVAASAEIRGQMTRPESFALSHDWFPTKPGMSPANSLNVTSLTLREKFEKLFFHGGDKQCASKRPLGQQTG